MFRSEATVLDAIVAAMKPLVPRQGAFSSGKKQKRCSEDGDGGYPPRRRYGRRPLVEVGAGMGYWAALIQQRLCSTEESGGTDHSSAVVALDINPPGAPGGYNDYHGHSHPFTTVLQGRAEDAAAILSTDRPYSLLICYPTPGTDMALRALRAFMRDARCSICSASPEEPWLLFHVGEFEGLTGSIEFEAELTKYFTRDQTIPLPQWGTDAAELTIWRFDCTRPRQTLPLLACSRPGCTAAACHRCRFSRSLMYCGGAKCFAADTARRREALALQPASSTIALAVTVA